MPDLIILIPNHGYSESDQVFVSWLDARYYVRDEDVNSFKISTDDSDSNIVQFTETITDGFVRLDDGTGTATITGLDHLEGRLVTVTSGGEIIGSSTVVDGSVTLQSEVTTFQVGLPYTMKVRTMRLSVPQDGGTLQTRIKRINETTVRYIRTKGGKAGQEYGGVEYLTDMDTTFSTESKDDTHLTKGGFTEDAYTVITSDDPFPCTVLSTIVSFEVEERR
jgi:hypothetical protein